MDKTIFPFYLSCVGIGGILFFLILERVISFREISSPKWPRWLINFGLSFSNLLLVDQGFVILLQRTPLLSRIFYFDLYGKLGLSSFWRIVLTIFILDFAMYLWHRLNHALPFFWRFHRVHHSDPHVDVTTASRFHFGEMTLSAVINYALMLSLGASLWEVRIFKLFFIFMTQFSHSNIRLVPPLEEVIRPIFIWPSMHRVHHSDVRRETDSNYGTIFSFWDRWLRTMVKADALKVHFGLKEFQDPKRLSFPGLLAMPFRPVFIFLFLILAGTGMGLATGFYLPDTRLVDTSTPLSIDPERSRRVDFDYEVLVGGVPPGAKELQVWIPYLPDTPYQEVQDVQVESQESATMTYDKTYHNKILKFTIASPKESSLKFNVRYRVKRSEYSNRYRAARSALGATEDLSHHLKPNRLVTLSPKIRSLSKEITQGKTTTPDKARALYDYVFQNVSYDKTVPGWGNGDTERVCLLKTGNCTDFHSLFISLARAAGIPAKFVMGVPLAHDKTEGEIPGYHCWAEFYDEKLGWVPVDISEAWKNNSKIEYYFGSIGTDRLELSVGRDIVIEPNAHTEPLNYFLYPYVEVDGRKFEQVKTVFRFKDVL